jgi:hypothetical protein
MNRFEQALRLTLSLEKLIDEGKGDDPEADSVREDLDSFVGWCGPHYLPENRLTEEEEQLLAQVMTACRQGKP